MLSRAGPAEKDVARALHEALAFDNPKTLMGIAAFAARRLQYRPARFLDLKEEWICFIGEKQCEITASADTAHPNHFYCDVLKRKR